MRADGVGPTTAPGRTSYGLKYDEHFQHAHLGIQRLRTANFLPKPDKTPAADTGEQTATLTCTATPGGVARPRAAHERRNAKNQTLPFPPQRASGLGAAEVQNGPSLNQFCP